MFTKLALLSRQEKLVLGLFFILALGLCFFIIPLGISLQSPRVSSDISLTPTDIPIDTSIPLSVVTTSPYASQTDSSIVQPITITFSRPLLNREKASVRATLTPSVGKFEQTWSEDQKTLFLIPSIALQQQSRYSLVLKGAFPEYSFNFTTTSFANLTPQDILLLQSYSDKEVADKTKAIDDAYPWIDKLPLQTEAYFVYFDVEKKSFIAKLYTDQTNSEESLREDVIVALESNGVPHGSYPIEWTITPAP